MMQNGVDKLDIYYKMHLVSGGNLLELSEDDVSSEHILQRLALQHVIEGEVCISFDGEEWCVVDELWAAVQNICFDCAITMVGKRRPDFRYLCTSQDFIVTFTDLGENLEVKDSDGRCFTVNKSILFHKALECGKRFIRLLIDIPGGSDGTRIFLEKRAQSATDVLMAAGIIPDR
ncbi:hypothetical protein E4191_11115 [Paracoccus liaowanqingii]|uniref:Uncharacterized protein n=1 Tax=Paracoccus liaowanqingii TaxID=2560053 RepID=A0A4P7HLS0_9RHOB|nr:hypothetical protein [Paracoccus liaowanqingii]QBX35184.1 hypothetical protein E4191_11115 [Paracoccus liaowanqingii]